MQIIKEAYNGISVQKVEKEANLEGNYFKNHKVNQTQC